MDGLDEGFDGYFYSYNLTLNRCVFYSLGKKERILSCLTRLLTQMIY